MIVNKSDIPVKIDVPGAHVRHLGGFGDAPQDGPMAAEHLQLAAGTDIAPLLRGLDGDACQAPHWGYLVAGSMIVDYTDGSQDKCSAGDLVYWPAGHSVRVVEDAELILFSPAASHLAVMDHMLEVMSG